MKGHGVLDRMPGDRLEPYYLGHILSSGMWRTWHRQGVTVIFRKTSIWSDIHFKKMVHGDGNLECETVGRCSDGKLATAQISSDEMRVCTGGAQCRAPQGRPTHQQVYRWCVFLGSLPSSKHSSWHNVVHVNNRCLPAYWFWESPPCKYLLAKVDTIWLQRLKNRIRGSINA